MPIKKCIHEIELEKLTLDSNSYGTAGRETFGLREELEIDR